MFIGCNSVVAFSGCVVCVVLEFRCSVVVVGSLLYVYSSWCATEGQTQVSGQAELYPLLLARLTWAGRIAGRRIIWFIDNESARQAMIRAYSPVVSSLLIIVDCVTFDYTHAVQSWHARVPTGCNIADAPSRLKMSKFLVDVECRVVDPVSPAGPAMLESMVGRFG